MEDHARIVLEAQELRAMLEKASEDGARKALAAVGLEDKEAAGDLRDLRQVMSDWRAVRRSVLTALGTALVLGVLGLIGLGVRWHLKQQ